MMSDLVTSDLVTLNVVAHHDEDKKLPVAVRAWFLIAASVLLWSAVLVALRAILQ
jgi:hypothetical protein